MHHDKPDAPLRLCSTKFYSDIDEEDGQPRLSFYNGHDSIVFSSDRGFNLDTGKQAEPQIFLVTDYTAPAP